VTGSGTDGTAGTNATDGTDGTTTTDPSSTLTDGTTTQPGTTSFPGELGCSDDLHKVVDEQGNPVETCPSDQACYAGACVPACEAVADLAGTVGCDFWAPTPPFINNGQGSALDGPCFAVFLANAWNGPANITVCGTRTRSRPRRAGARRAGSARMSRCCRWPSGSGRTARRRSTGRRATVRSQDPEHPFLFSQYMTGTSMSTRPGCTSQFMNIPCGLGDEEWVSLLSPKQFQNRYIFFTDPTYGTTNLVIIRAKGSSGFADVTVECLGVVDGWMPVGAEGIYEYAHVDLERGGVPVGDCGTSRHLAESEGPFGVVVWGTDLYASYGYPAGSDISKINEVELPVPG
jgi:hypothetical protein